MTLSRELIKATENFHLLTHPFYQAWEEGKLDKDILKTYAKQYYHHVKAFPRYISATHSLCEELPARQVLLENLSDEEMGDGHHPGLWLDFAEGLGADEAETESEALLPETRELIDTFFTLARSSYLEGLVALYVYEQQIPEICESKIAGLKKWYGIEDNKTLEYFRLHGEIDILHSEATATLVDQLTDEQREIAFAAAETAKKALWKFLDGMEKLRVERGGATCDSCIH